MTDESRLTCSCGHTLDVEEYKKAFVSEQKSRVCLVEMFAAMVKGSELTLAQRAYIAGLLAQVIAMEAITQTKRLDDLMKQEPQGRPC